MRPPAIGIVEDIGVAAPETAPVAPRSARLDHPSDTVAHAAEMHRDMRGIGDQRALGIEQRAGEIEAFLDVDRGCGRLQHHAHFLGDGHEQIVENLEPDRVGFGTQRAVAAQRLPARQHQASFLGDLRLPARFDHCGRSRVDHQRGALDAVARGHRRARDGVPGARGRARGGDRCRLDMPEAARVPAGLHAERLDDDRGFGIRIAEALAMERAKGGVHRFGPLAGDGQQAVTARKPQPSMAFYRNGVRRDALFDQRRAGILFERAQVVGEILFQPAHNAHFADRLYRRQPDAIGRENPRERVDQHGFHAQFVGDPAGVLAAGTAETGERIGGDIVPARDADLANGIGHVVDCNGEKAFGDRGEVLRLGQRRSHCFEPFSGRIRVERLVAAGSEHAGEERRVDPAKEQIAVGNRQRSALAITGGTGIGARAFRPDAEPSAIELADRAAPGSDRMDLHHRRGHAHARNHAVAGHLVFARVMRDIGAGPAHVEPDQPVVPERGARGDHPDHAARGARQDGILAAERTDFGKPAVRLHEPQAVRVGQPRLQRIGIAAQNG